MNKTLITACLVITIALLSACGGSSGSGTTSAITAAFTLPASTSGIAVNTNIVVTLTDSDDVGITTSGSWSDVLSLVTTGVTNLCANLIAWDATAKTITCNPASNLSVDTSYTATFSGLTDANGETIADATLTFTTSSSTSAWTTPENISNTSNQAYEPSLAVDSNGVVHITWEEPVGNIYKIYYANSDDWTTQTDISNTANSARYPSIAIGSDDVVHITWEEYVSGDNRDIFYAKKPSGGWTTPANISDTVKASWSPSIAVDSSGNAHVAWKETVNSMISRITYAKSTDWTIQAEVSAVSVKTYYPSIAIAPDDTVHIAWYQADSGIDQIYHAESTDSWSNETNISDTTDDSQYPSIAVDSNGDAHVTWWEVVSGDNEIYYANSSDSWATPTNISNMTGSSESPSIAIDSGNVVHIAWRQVVDSDFQIYHSTSSDWATQTDISNSSSDSNYPSMAIDSSDIAHVAWQEDIAGSPYEIYYSNSGGQGHL